MSEVAISTRPVLVAHKQLPHSRPDLRYRLLSHLSHPTVLNWILRTFSAKNMSVHTRQRWLMAGVSAHDLDRVLPTIRSLNDWWHNWRAHAAQREQEAQWDRLQGQPSEAAAKFLQASALYSLSALGTFMNLEHHQVVSRKIVETYAQAVLFLDPPAQRVLVPFDGIELAGYLRLPNKTLTARLINHHGIGKHPVVILISGTGSCKEDMRHLEDLLLTRGLATLSVDGPGVGESWHQMGWRIEQELVAAAKLRTLEQIPQIDAQRVALLGLSLGGLSALRMASRLHRFKAVAAICPPYDGPSYYHQVPYVVRETIHFMSRLTHDELNKVLPFTTMRGHVQRIRCPLFVVGAGRDTIVPGADARLIVAEAAAPKELLWYPYDEHLALQHLHEWPLQVADWLQAQV